jgi:hypothetical protein
VATEQNSTLIVPIPIDILTAFLNGGTGHGEK